MGKKITILLFISVVLITVTIAMLILGSYTKIMREGMLNKIDYNIKLTDTTKTRHSNSPVGSYKIGVLPFDTEDSTSISDIIFDSKNMIDFSMNLQTSVKDDFGDYGGVIIIIQPKVTLDTSSNYFADIFPKIFEISLKLDDEFFKISYNKKNGLTYYLDSSNNQSIVMNIFNKGPIYDLNNNSIGDVLQDYTNPRNYTIYIKDGSKFNKINIVINK